MSRHDTGDAVPPLEELDALRRRVAELEQTEKALRERERLYRSLLDMLQQNVFCLDREGRCLFANKRLLGTVGMTLEQILGKTTWDLYQPQLAEQYRADDRRVMETGEVFEAVETHHIPVTGETLFVQVVKAPLRDADGAITGIQGIFWDVTASHTAQRLSQEISSQAAALRELGTPLLPIADGVIVMPLIGTIDRPRADQVLETLLGGVARQRARVAILDVTGVKEINAEVADALVRVASAVKLLGARVVLTGLNPSLAQTIVMLGVNMGGIVTRGTLRDGIAYALQGPSAMGA
jgi:rsbT co-antagonist protein RsbR